MVRDIYIYIYDISRLRVNISIDDICIVINHAKYIYLVVDIRFFHVVKSCNWMVTFTFRY